jgi:site-specific DNA-adenine methylase
MITTKALANWFGSNRILAASVGVQLGRCEWVGVPFCGGCSELPFIKTRSGIASDLHRHLVNLARVIRDPLLKDALSARLMATLFHEDELKAAQGRCWAREAVTDAANLFAPSTPIFAPAGLNDPDVDWAFEYFLCTWMTAGGRSGTAGEFNQSMSVRWNASGGDSCRRFRSAAESLDGWCKAMAPWNFVCRDAFEFLDDCKDEAGHGIYVDAPWPDDGDGYKHPFTERQQRDLARRLTGFKSARVVVRFGDHPLIRKLYPAPPDGPWNWIRQTSRAQSNDAVSEVLILNGPSLDSQVSKRSLEERP